MMMTNKITFRVPDMSCDHCVKIIRQAIETAIDGSRVEADIANHLVTVTGSTDIEKIAAVIAEQDYHLEPL